MDGIEKVASELGSTAAMATNKLETPLDPLLNVPSRQIIVNIIDEAAISECNFWVCLAKDGFQHPNELLEKFPTLEARFEHLAKNGLKVDEPTLLVDTASSITPSFLFTVPHKSIPEQDVDRWASFLASRIDALDPSAIGIYFSPKILAYDLASQIMLNLLKGMALSAEPRHIFLFTGDHRYTRLLNLMLHLRQQLRQNRIDLAVFH